MNTQNSSDGNSLSWMDRSLAALRVRFSLAEDRAADEDIDLALRTGAIMQGSNLWVLMLAILIASVGLNVNSTAVVIGAMLISPLMGPIMGVGYGAGILDLQLIRTGLRNLGIAAAIALVTSTIYFLLTPLNVAQSELLARTSPSIWDVLIAFFGGIAGIVAVTRKQPSNVIPGVAIATALMPPLCTAGYGLATGQWKYFLGAFYLFVINGVFIAVAAALVVSAYHVRRKQFVDARTERRVRGTIAAVVLVTLVPSLYLAYELVVQEVFRSRAMQFIHQQLDSERTHVAQVVVDSHTRRIETFLIGDPVPDSVIADIQARLPTAGLAAATVKIFQSTDHGPDVGTLRAGLLADMYKASREEIQLKDSKIATLTKELEDSREKSNRYAQISKEMNALYPQIVDVWMSTGHIWTPAKADSSNDKAAASDVFVVNVSANGTLSQSTRRQIVEWLQIRTGEAQVRLLVNKEN